METRCQKCGEGLGADQAFCPKCGAVVGMGEAAPSRDGGWDMAATIVGQQSQPATPRRPSAERPALPVQPDAPQPRPATRGNTALLAVIGFVAVLLVGLLVLLYLNSRG